MSSDEAEADFKRTLELIGQQTGDQWLSFAEAVALIQERSPTSIGRAEAMVDAAMKSGEVRHQCYRDDGLLSKPTRNNTFFSKADLVDWLDWNLPAEKPSSSSSPRASKKQIREMVARYLRSLPPDVNSSMDAAVEFAETNNLTGHREEIREEYRRQTGHRRSGRPRKNNPPK